MVGRTNKEQDDAPNPSQNKMLNNYEAKHFAFAVITTKGDVEGEFRSLKEAREYAKWKGLGQYEIIVEGAIKILNNRIVL